jgi:hypothetical protein
MTIPHDMGVQRWHVMFKYKVGVDFRDSWFTSHFLDYFYFRNLLKHVELVLVLERLLEILLEVEEKLIWTVGF